MQCSCKSTTHRKYWGNCSGNSDFLVFVHRNKSCTSGFKVWKRMSWTGAAVNAFWFGFFYLVFHQVLKSNSSCKAGFKCCQVFYKVHCMNGVFFCGDGWSGFPILMFLVLIMNTCRFIIFFFCLRDGFFSPKCSLLKVQLCRAGTAF